MKSIQQSINIKANAAQVWQILMDFDAYPQWNPFVTQISGKAAVGSPLKVSIQLEGQSLQHFTPEVLIAKDKEEFRWRGKLFFTGLFDGEHYFQLKAISDTETQLIHGENFSGILVRPLLALIGAQTEAGFIAFNQAIKQRAEGKR